MAKDHKESDMDRIGLFREMSYLHDVEGEPPAHHVDKEESSKSGKRPMVMSCSKVRDGTQAGYFDRTFPRTFEGEASLDPVSLNRRSRTEAAKLNLAGAFKPSSGPKMPCGLGTNFGTFVEYEESKMESFSPAENPWPDAEHVKRNVQTNPGKKGTGFGYPNVTIGETPPYFTEEEFNRLKNMTYEPKRPVPPQWSKPFVEGMREREFFDPNPFFDDKPGRRLIDNKQKQKKKSLVVKPFVPGGCPKKDGGMKAGCLNPFPVYMENPYLERELVGRGVRRYVNKENKMFRPVPGLKPYPVKSIINKNVEKSMIPTNFETVKCVVYCKK